MNMQKHPRKLCKAFWGFRLKPIQLYQNDNKKSIRRFTFQNNKINNTHSFYSPSLEEYIQVNDNEFEDIRNEEIELRAPEARSSPNL